ncbi:hypothetical protein [Qipengyuania marisflavi]|uniref:Uncharacterized protein n=1 Tax=Qipengyuania marisflavi TaxID=2486356 RepID=A0A5S3P6R8_9SPHN|nr:hypothetical protein [Qipengyuania marisflavi]TMM48870.1 hypothetical protein FEV51_05640 [Qipengyuania marisflavi]
MLNFALSLAVLAAFALLAGAYVMWRRTGNVQQAVLMAIMALVALVNVGIWTIPDKDGEAPLEKLERGSQ